MNNSEKDPRKKPHRSPGYPSMDLGTAIATSRQIYQKEGFNPTPPGVAIGHLGYSPKASSGVRAVAALAHFGLLESDGGGTKRKVWLSKRAKQILLDDREDSKERATAIAEAALQPDLYKEMWEKWGPELPSDATIRHYLILEENFNPEIVPSVIKNFRATIELAKPGKNDILSIGGDDTPTDNIDDTNVVVSPGEEAKMPEIGRDNTQVFDLPIFLGAGRGTLRLPVPLSKEDFERLEKVLKSGIEFVKNAFVRGDEAQPES